MDRADEQPDRGAIDASARPVRTEADLADPVPSVAVVETIASIEGVDPVALSADGGITLRDHVDPDALDRLLAGERGNSIAVTFTVDDYRVRIGNGELSVEGPRDR